MGFSVFQHGVSPSVEQTLADPHIRRLLTSLLAEHLFLTAGQARQYLLQAAPPDTPLDLVCEDYVRKVLDRLVRAGYLVAATTMVPPVTIGEVPFICVRNNLSDRPPTLDEIKPSAQAALERVPDLALHKPRRLYCAANRPRAAQRNPGSPSREAVFRSVYDSHTEVLARDGHSAREIACTRLTAHYNANHLRFMRRFRVSVASGNGEYAVNPKLSGRLPDARVGDAEFGRVVVYFTRPSPAQELCEQVASHHREYRVGAFFDAALWL